MVQKTLTPGVADSVAKFIQQTRDKAAGKASASPFNEANPLQLPTTADVEHFVQAMEAEAARIDAEANELRTRRLAEIAEKDAQIAALNRDIEAATARHNEQEAEVSRRAIARGKLIETVKKIAPKLDTGNLSEDAIRRAVVQGRFGADAVAGKTQAYIDCRFDLAVRGQLGALRVFERSISSRAADYDGAVQFLVEHFNDVLAGDYLDPTEAYAVNQDLDVYVAGWGRQGPAAHWISNYRASGKIHRIDGVHVSPMVDFDAQQRFAVDVKMGMPRLMADQTQQNPGVGGWIMVTEVQENMILSYPLGGLDGLSAVTSRMQTQEEIDAFAEIDRQNAERQAQLAAVSASA